MNKLLQYMISAANVKDRVLPGLQKMQRAGQVTAKAPVDPRVFPKETLERRQKVYRTVRPTDYTDLKNYIRFAFNNDRDEYDDVRSEEAFKLYLGLENKPKYFRPSKYKPTINADPNGYYYSADDQLEQDIFNSFKDKVKPGQILPTDEYFVDSKFPGNPNAFWEGDKQMVKFEPNDENPLIGRPMVSRARALGQFVVSRGSDKQGDYLSYSDQYDFPEKLQNQMQGSPYKIYGRVYYPKAKKQYGGTNSFLETLKQKYGGQPCYKCGGQKMQQGGPILDPRGQWAHPGQVTRIPSNSITMQGVPYPVYGVGSNGQQQMMYPGQEYNFGGASYVDEYPMMQGGGTAYVDSVLNANRNLDWVKRLYQKNGPNLQIPGLKGPSTHYMESGDGRVYPKVAMVKGKLTYLPAAGIDPFDYADSTKTYIQFPTDQQATWFGKNYKQGTGVLPKNASGGQHGGLDRWFAEKWVDVKSGKACGRQEGENRAYPACRPSKRISSQTPKTSSEMSPAEKAKFKRTKTSSQRIPYNHKK